MRSYLRIQVPSLSLAGLRGAPAGPAGADPFRRSRGRLPGPVGGDQWRASETRLLEETLAGGSITLELNHDNDGWRITPPAFAHWTYHLPAAHGRWARSGDEITIGDASNQH